ncbi:energy transducer TonB [bacterium]|nr:energy transducer TonB [bacterium]
MNSNIRLCYAVLISLAVHVIVIALWPRINPLQIIDIPPVLSVNLYEDPLLIESENKGPDTESRTGDFSTVDRSWISGNAIQTGKVVTDNIIEKRETGLRDRPDYIKTLHTVNLPKQSVMFDSMELESIWPEEFTGPWPEDIVPYQAPKAAKAYKAPSKAADLGGINAPLSEEEFPEEKHQSTTPDITWKGEPRKWVRRPESIPLYHGDEEGIVKLRFWVNEHGEVINAIPVQKLSAGLEEKALAYIYSWRFERSTGRESQEGIIRIYFRLE